MAEVTLEPYAPYFMESMRAVGYSLGSAIADVIDNSISAGARDVDVEFRGVGEPYVAIVDDGIGMDEAEIVQAMRHGGRSPSEEREEMDLGRFGLGLKTASLSQCRRLTVASVRKGRLVAARWDLDLVAARRNWTLWRPDDEKDVLGLPCVARLVERKNGTVVLWQDLDQLAAGESSVESALSLGMDAVRPHVALVFHRFMSGEVRGRKLRIRFNGRDVDPVDPFLTAYTSTQQLPEERFRIEDQEVVLKPFILPHWRKLSAEEIRTAGGEEGLKRNQGFYLYRSYRLITLGNWFRLAPSEELSKLARVRIDIPNSLDHLWSLDIKKSSAQPPEAVRENLRRVVERIRGTSRNVYRFRGRSVGRGETIHAWERIEGRERGISYRIDREYPLLKGLRETLDRSRQAQLDALVKTLESTFPVDALYDDLASDRQCEGTELGIEALREVALQLLETAGEDEERRRWILEKLPLMEPFSAQPAATLEIVKELRLGHQ